MYNPEPLADFVDIVSLGEGEDVTVELIELLPQGPERRAGVRRSSSVELPGCPGLYVPSLYTSGVSPRRHRKGDRSPRAARPGWCASASWRIWTSPIIPVKTIVPSTEIVHDRVMLELFRGCIRGLPILPGGLRVPPGAQPQTPGICVCSYGEEACEDSGYQEMTLLLLSAPATIRQLTGAVRRPAGILPGAPCESPCRCPQPPGGQLLHEPDGAAAAKGRKSGLTFAPEAGTQRLRDAINKNVTEEELLALLPHRLLPAGTAAVKLYFMLGLPTETDEDVLGIADLAARVMHAWRESASNTQAGRAHHSLHLLVCA